MTSLELPSFAERLLALIDDGRRTSTYKLALLLALMDACAEGTSPAGASPTTVATHDLADRIAGYYWQQLRPYVGGAVLRQSSNARAEILESLLPLRTLAPRGSTWATAKACYPHEAARAVASIERTVCRYPVLRLQRVAGVLTEVIYEQPWWGESVGPTDLQGARLVLLPGAADHLIRLAPLVRPLVELHWVRKVAALNRLVVPDDDVRRHLFGAERAAFPAPLRRGLVDLQQGKCFYCSGRLGGTPPLDHFIPWSRWPNDAIENLVAVDSKCNTQKSDRIAARMPLERWVERLRSLADELALVARDVWITEPGRSVALARGVYGHVPAQAPLWAGPDSIDDTATSAELLAVLAILPG